jgi:hypothetical protein
MNSIYEHGWDIKVLKGAILYGIQRWPADPGGRLTWELRYGAEVGYGLGIARLKSKIKGYKNAIEQTKHTIKQLGNGMAADTYESDGSVKF